MAPLEIAPEYNTYEGRLASFQTAQPLAKRRASTVSSKAPKAAKWPHKFLSPEEMAKAGFFHFPTQNNPDNTTCFLCRRSLDGWEDGDDPLQEHLKYSSNCGWAIVTSIEARHEELSEEYPLSERMLEARRATFGDRWPHEDKKGWKCKVKQLVDAGWKYTPTPEYDDMATCTYCGLALDGWEPGDKPLDEHQRRSPDCPFFQLIQTHEELSVPKKSAKGRKPRASKASRLSTQSNFTVASEAPSIIEEPAEVDDSILTTATVTSVAGKKMPKAKKAAKGRKTKVAVDEPVEISALPEPEDDDFEVKVPQPKAKKGKKRTSDAMEPETTAMEPQEPPAKRRVTRNTRASNAVEVIHAEPMAVDYPDLTLEVDNTASEIIVPKKKGRASTAKGKRNVSTASKATLRVEAPDEEEIEKALEADLERPLSDNEDDNMVVEEAKPRRESRARKPTAKASQAPTRKTSRASKLPAADHDMFAVGNVSVDEAAIEAELEAMELEQPVPLPKAKGAKGRQPRKPSVKQQVAAKQDEKVQEEAETVEHAHIPTPTTAAPEPEVEEDHNTSITSEVTVVKGANKRQTKAKGGKKATKSAVMEPEAQVLETGSVEQQEEEQPKKKSVRSKKTTQTEDDLTAPETAVEANPPPEEPVAPVPTVVKQTKVKQTKAKGKDKAFPPAPIEEVEPRPPQFSVLPAPRSSFAAPRSPLAAPKELTPSLSPQSSDAENQPPTSRSSLKAGPATQTQTHTSRIPLAPGTPTHNNLSPSKRTGGFRSAHPWTAIDLDSILLKSPSDILSEEKENSIANTLLAEALGRIKKSELTSPEKKMTVEEWILHNADLAAERLRGECERMVGIFETEGARAMRVLEGMVVD